MRRVGLIGAALLAIGLGAGIVVLTLDGSEDDRTTWPPVEPGIRTALPDYPPLPAEPGPKGSERIESMPVSASLEPYTLQPPLLIRSGISFAPEGATPTLLTGVDAPAANAICKNEEGLLWACGLQARAALNNLIRGKPVTCRPEAVTDTHVAARCAVDGQDLAQLLVERGFARSLDTPVSPAEERARAAKAGLWNGAWSVRP